MSDDERCQLKMMLNADLDDIAKNQKTINIWIGGM